jgi:Transposase IS4
MYGTGPYNDLIKELEIPVFIDDYNHNMRGVDIANQLRESFETHKATLRNWWPLFYWLIDVTVINSYRLYRIHMIQLGQKSSLLHLQFRTALYCYLFSYSRSTKIHQLQLELGSKRLFSNGFENIHQKVKRKEANPCE